jgi:hypothetical protein
MSTTPAAKFLTSLDTYIEARIEKSTLQFQRLHAGPRAELEAKCDERIQSARQDVEDAVEGIMLATRRPRI